MPELPEVQTVVVTLRPKIIGKTIRAVVLTRRDIVTPADVDLPALLLGRRIESIDRRGKRIVFALDDGNRFYVHLGMSGQLIVTDPDAPLPPHTHLMIAIQESRVRGRGSGREANRIRRGAPASRLLTPDSCSQLRFRDPRRFGGVWWLGRDTRPDAGMGPEPLNLRPAQLFRQLRQTSRAVKNALLDQTVVAGLGNIYVDESLFAAGIHPLKPANVLTLEEIARLNRSIKAVLRRALRHRGSTLRDYRDADGSSGSFQKLHRVYGREAKPCRKCQTPIERIVLGGRSTHFCPKCQPKRRTNLTRLK